MKEFISQAQNNKKNTQKAHKSNSCNIIKEKNNIKATTKTSTATTIIVTKRTTATTQKESLNEKKNSMK